MVDIVSLINASLSLVEKVRNLLKSARKDASERSEQKRKDAEALLSNISYLINKFAESVDITLATVEKWDEGRNRLLRNDPNDTRLSETFQANRRLFEISSEMRVVTASIKRFSSWETSIINRITERCLQIVFLEGLVSVRLAQENQFDILPINPGDRTFLLGAIEFFKGAEYLPAPYDKIETLSYFNSLLLQLTLCKEKIALALLESESN
jgi:hypothetical protein